MPLSSHWCATRNPAAVTPRIFAVSSEKTFTRSFGTCANGLQKLDAAGAGRFGDAGAIAVCAPAAIGPASRHTNTTLVTHFCMYILIGDRRPGQQQQHAAAAYSRSFGQSPSRI